MILRALSPSALLMIAFASSAQAGAWSEDSNPFFFGPRFDAHLAALPLTADLSPSLRPWSGSFWSDRQGSIGYRWQSGVELWNFAPPTLADLKTKLSPAEIFKLSPAEKIDILRGRYDYPTLALIRTFASPNDPEWKGACSGWSQSALNFEAPIATTRKNPDGIDVPFAAGDLQALAAFYYDFIAVSEDPVHGYDDRAVAQIGRKCDAGMSGGCGNDLNPGALHIVLANRIGAENRGVIADFERGSEVWQHPIYGYSAELRGERAPSASAAPNAVREVRVRLKLHSADYLAPDAVKISRVEMTDGLNYWLEIDGDGKIVGGRYTAIGPGKILDYLWISGPIRFGRGYEVLGDLLVARPEASSRF